MARIYIELYKKDLHDPDNHDGVIMDLEPDVLEWEVKWALESITTNKASGGDGIPGELVEVINTRWPPRQQTREEGTLLPFHGSICGCPAEGAFPWGPCAVQVWCFGTE